LTVADRLEDLALFLQAPADYLDFSGRGTRTGLMSGRIDLINAYMANFVAGPDSAWLVGLGPASGDKIVGVYAHNELVSALVETGILGLMALLFLLWRFADLASARKAVFGGISIGVAGGIYAMAVMTLGTMPFRNARALMVLGVLLGLAEASSRVYHSRPRFNEAAPWRLSTMVKVNSR
jgi:hypothetical protein